MKRLTQDLRRMLTGLAYEGAGDYLSAAEKSRLLNRNGLEHSPVPPPRPLVSQRPSRQQIALVSDGRGEGAPLDYAIETALRQEAQIDLLFHGRNPDSQPLKLEKRLQQAGVPYRLITLLEPVVEDLLDYLNRQRSLICLVAMPEDKAVRSLIEEVIPDRSGPVPVPLVLIEAKSRPRSPKRSLA